MIPFRSLLTAATGLALTLQPLPAQVPTTRADSARDNYFGQEIVDPYRWLEDQDSPETREWIREQNAYSETVLGALPWRGNITTRLTDLLMVDAVGSPTVRQGRYFFSKRAADQALSAISMREGPEGADRVLIDPNTMATDRAVSVTLMSVSKDGSLLAYGIREGGQDEVLVRFYDVDQRRVLRDHLSKARYFGISFAPNNSGFYYTHFGPQGPRVYFHTLGSDSPLDVEVFGEGYGSDKIIFSRVSGDGRYLLITVSHGSAGHNELFLKDILNDGPVVPMVNDVRANFSADFAGDRVVVQTDWEAPRGRVFVVDLSRPAHQFWREIIPENDAVIRGVSPVGGNLFVNYLEDVVGRIEVFDLEGVHLRDIEMPTLGSISGVDGNWEGDEAFFSFSSYHVPLTVYRYTVSGNTREVWNRRDIQFDSERFETRQVWYTSKDGTPIPMFVVHAKGIPLDGNNPTYLTGYGGFNLTRTPGFSAVAALWIERGGVYAVPNLRGGGEFGEEWHRAGMLENKQNVFDDLVSAAEWLVDNGYTKPSKLATAGGSNGGLLVGAVMTQRPDLFRAVVCRVPLLDMIRYHKFLVARFWVPEYGSSDDPQQFRYILEYSPYHNVVPGTNYPAVLFVSGDGDTRVAPLHARKMTALMQAATGSDPSTRPVLLRYDTEAGHSRGMPITSTIDDLTARLAFLFWQLGVPAEVPVGQ